MRSLLPACLALCGAVTASADERTPRPAGAEIYIISPADGARVHNPVKVQFGLTGMGIAPAGVKFDNTGHHHLLIDTPVPADPNAPLPASDKLLHFGKGQTETVLHLTPGRHTLQLILGDAGHVPLNPPLISRQITVVVAD